MNGFEMSSESKAKSIRTEPAKPSSSHDAKVLNQLATHLRDLDDLLGRLKFSIREIHTAWSGGRKKSEPKKKTLPRPIALAGARARPGALPGKPSAFVPLTPLLRRSAMVLVHCLLRPHMP